MSIYKNLQLIWNRQFAYRTLFRRLSVKSNYNLNYSTTTVDLNENKPINEITQTKNLIKQSKKARFKAEQTRLNTLRKRLNDEDSLKELNSFLTNVNNNETDAIISKRKQPIPYLPVDFLDGNDQQVFIETYGCQVINLIFTSY